MTSSATELLEAQEELESVAKSLSTKEITAPLDALEKHAKEVGRSWSGSWLGYQSSVYYEGFKLPPPGTHFSSEWGFDSLFDQGTTGIWKEVQFDAVKSEIFLRAGSPDLTKIYESSASARERFEDRRSQILSILETYLSRRPDSFLQRLLEEAKNTKPLHSTHYIANVRPTSSIISRDALAVSQGIRTPAHVSVLAEVFELRSPQLCSTVLAKIIKQATAHLGRVERDYRRTERLGTNVFIGHGRSHLWKDLKDFLQDRLRLPWDEFNRVPVAGVTNIARLSEMLDSAAIALLVMTAEDEQIDGTVRARMNVIHEAGLFQGRLGLMKAIVLLEEGCDEFTNIQGLGQIRFPKGNIKASFEEIRQVLEREGLIDTK